MPQIEMPINNATSTELTIEGGQDGKERMTLREGRRGLLETSLIIRHRYELRREAKGT